MNFHALLVGVLLVIMGMLALVSPKHIVKFFGIFGLTPDFRNEIRAVYGGFGVLTGLLLVVAEQYFFAMADGIYLTVAIALLGMALGRVISFFIERTGKWPVVFLVVELIGGGLLISSIQNPLV